MRAAWLGLCLSCSQPLPTVEPDPAPVEPGESFVEPGGTISEAPAPIAVAEGPDHLADYADVLIVGSGAAGLAAGFAAREAGASVLILERDRKAGAGITYATRALAVGTAYQASRGVTDSVEQAVEDWSSITGVDGDEPGVYNFLSSSAETLSWVIGYGFALDGLGSDPDSGSVSRLHQVRGEDTRKAMVAAFDGELRLRVEVDSLVVRDGRVVGAWWTDLDTGERGATGAGAVVLATGGFLRDRALVDASRPELEGRRLLYETNPQSDGGGVGLLESVGASFVSRENIGIYLHAMQDPELSEGEALIIGAMDYALLVDSAGQRFAAESMSRSLDFFDMAPDDELYAVLPDAVVERYTAGRPDYNWTDPEVEEGFSLPELAEISDEVQVAASVSELAELAGIDPDELERTVARAAELAEAGGTDELGRSFAGGPSYVDTVWWSVHLRPGLAKAFGGVSIDTAARVQASEGQPIPGLFAAGELVGMLPDGGAGTGFSGSIMACYYYGRVAGQGAAAEAILRR